jgi:diguanylate cyclase (GGDEF)-like protein/PAS domain S-box-containing protein
MNKLHGLGKIGRWVERHLPIADKIGIPLAAIAVVTATALSTNAIASARRQIDQTYKMQAHQIANAVQANLSISSNHSLTDPVATGRFLQELKRYDTSVLKINIYRIVNGSPVLWASSDGSGGTARRDDVLAVLTGETDQIIAETEAKLETILPLVVEGQTVASIAVYTSLGPRNEAITAVTRSIILTSAMGISAQSAALMVVVYWVVLRRMKYLSHAALRVAEGDLAVPLPSYLGAGRDEILQVTCEFGRMLDGLQRRSQQQNALAALAQQALKEVDITELLEQVTLLVSQILQVDQVDIFELLPDQKGLKLRTAVGEAQLNCNEIVTVAPDSLPDYTLRTHEPVVIENLALEHRFTGLQLLEKQGIVSSISVLITNFEKPFGILSVHSKTQRAFSNDESIFLKAVASLTSTAIDRHRVEAVMVQAEAALVRAEAAEVAKQSLEREIIERQRIEAALRESEERYALAASGANDGLWDWNLKTHQVYFSGRWKSMLGYGDAEIGSHPNEWFDRIHVEDYERVQSELWHHREGQTAHFESEFRLRHKDGSYRWMLSRGMAVRDETGAVYRIAGSQTDVSARKQAEEQLRHLALHDELTGLANRVLFVDRLERAITCSSRQKAFVVIFLDLDRFKIINDSLGHLVGDQLLVATADRLRRCLRSSDICARLGGDEFAILLEGISDARDAIRLVERIQEELKAPFLLAGQEVYVNGSIGLVLNTGNYYSKEDLLRDADTAMYHSKASGSGQYTIFAPTMHEKTMTLLHLESELRQAFERQELQLFYQPILTLNNQRLEGFEALLRWQHPTRGLLLPADFLTVAEDTGLIIPIGWWVLREACQQMQQWQVQFGLADHVTMSVNLSGKQFSQLDLVSQVANILEETGLPPRRLKLEITETVVMTNATAAAEMMQHLKSLGVQLAIDDFGTGYSSLGYLHRFPIDTLKIDRSFITSADSDLEKLEITRTVIGLAWNLGMNVVAEGIETDRQMAQLKLLKCEQGQGFLFSEPLSRVAAATLLEELSSPQG